MHELLQRRMAVQRQLPLPVTYDGLELDAGYRLDLLVASEVIVEVKAVEALSRLHEAQLLTCLKLSDRRLGFLMNFNTPLFKDGVRRIAL